MTTQIEQPQQTNLPAPKPTLSDVVAAAIGEAKDPEALIQLAKAAAIKRMGRPESFKSNEERAVYDATTDHAATVSLGSMAGLSMIAFRIQSWRMFYDEREEDVDKRWAKWMNVRIPVGGDGDKVEYHKFSSYEEWFDFAATQARINPTAVSVIRSIITKLLKFMVNNPISVDITTKDKNGIEYVEERKITVADVLFLEQSKLEVISGGVTELLGKYAEQKDKGALTEIGRIVLDAQVLSKSDLKKKLSQSGHRGSRVRSVPTYISDAPDGEHVIYSLVLTPSQQKYIDGVLDGRLTEYPVDMDELTDTIVRAIKQGTLADNGEQAEGDDDEKEDEGTIDTNAKK